MSGKRTPKSNDLTATVAARELDITVCHLRRLVDLGRVPYLDLGTPGKKRALRFDMDAVKKALSLRATG